MSFAPPIARDGFYYNGDLYVEVGNLNRHKRASIPEITAILRPDLKQSKAVPPKDPVGHWYEAQLIHYGLPPSKDKARAKMRLLEALNTSRLVVPDGITRLEGQLKKEYTAADRKAKAQYKSDMTALGKSDSATAGKKRKLSEPTDTSPATKKAKSSATAASKKIKPTDVGDDHASPNIQTPIGSKTVTKKRTSGSVEKKPTVDQQLGLKRKPATKKETKVKKEESDKSAPAPVRPKPTDTKVSIKKPLAVKKEPKVKQESKPSDLPKLGSFDLTSYYRISCPDLEGQWSMFDNHRMSLILRHDSTGVWGNYDLGMFSGILHLNKKPTKASHERIPFKWRGRENSESMMSFGDSCTGEIAFLGDGRIEGVISVYGQCHFSGSTMQVAGPSLRLRQKAADMRQEWDGYNECAYEEAARNRWG